MTSLGTVLGWKFDHFPGIKTRNGVLTAWPEGLGDPPTQGQITAWTAEYENRPETPEEALARTDTDMRFVAEDVLHILLQNGTIGADDLDPGVVGILASRRALRGK
jgi:hypothetical protein